MVLFSAPSVAQGGGRFRRREFGAYSNGLHKLSPARFVQNPVLC